MPSATLPQPAQTSTSEMSSSANIPTHTLGNGTQPTAASTSASSHQHIWVITGPAGCGKTSVAEYLAQTLGLPYLEGDSYHPQANIEKMAAGHPLTDADRWDWLIHLREAAMPALSHPATNTATTPETSAVILTCSALKRKYRDVLRIASYNHPTILVHFLYLRADQELLLQRVHARQGHYMKDSMVKSQFESLEEPGQDEGDVVPVDVGGTKEEVQKTALEVVRKVMGVSEHGGIGADATAGADAITGAVA